MIDEKLLIKAGQIIVLRLFAVAYEIDLSVAEKAWAKSTYGESARARLVSTPPKAVSFGVPPLVLDLGAVSLEIKGARMAASASARLYDFGIAAFTVRIPASGMSWRDFSDLANAANEILDAAGGLAVWSDLIAQVRDTLGTALQRPSTKLLQEDYLIALVSEFSEDLSAEALSQRLDLVPILSGRDRALSEGARNDLLRNRFSYFPNDLAVITWDRAFLYEPQSETDVIDVLEIANAQLLEIRTYDELLDEELPRMRDLVEAARSRINLLASRRYARLARQLYTLVAEVTELQERVDNALQVTEDVYLARVYAAAITLFRVPTLGAAVDRKLAIIRETYTALYEEAEGARTELLELAVLALIALEVALSVFRHG